MTVGATPNAPHSRQMTDSTVAARIIAESLQAACEALEKLSSAVEPHRREAYDAAVKRVRIGRSELQVWAEENRR